MTASEQAELDVTRGVSHNQPLAERLVEVLRDCGTVGLVYLGYPLIATADQRVDVDALLVSRAHGLVAFRLPNDSPKTEDDWVSEVEAQDNLFAALVSSFSRHAELRVGRKLAFEVQTVSVFPTDPGAAPEGSDGTYVSVDELPTWLQELDPLPSDDVEKALNAAVQRVTTIKPAKKRAEVAQPGSRGSVIKTIESQMANLDLWQRKSAIESPEGPQRIRGLAGSGKTVVLALKAAYWHAQHPDWRIAMTFESKALMQQMTDLVKRFTFEFTGDWPDADFLQVMHAWGGASRAGVYSSMARALGEPVRDFMYASGTYGRESAFQGILAELLQIAQRTEVEPIFDAILIDEAQDFPPEFFKLAYIFTRPPKRVVFAYDELQKLSEAAMPDTRDLFGVDSDGQAIVTLHSPEDAPRQDIVLPVCYRNTPWALATAHALGLGIYRKQNLVQHPDDPGLWEEIGYVPTSGELAAGKKVTLVRSTKSYPPYFNDLITPGDAVRWQMFDDEAAQDAQLAKDIFNNISQDELDADDILIVLPSARTSRNRASAIRRELARLAIRSHLVGVDTPSDQVVEEGSVAIAHIFRAKGNEAPMVYVLDSQYAALNYNQITRRNTIFTAITRSRAWVRIYGWGPEMAEIAAEIEETVKNNFQLTFTIPTHEELAKLRHIHRDIPKAQRERINAATEGMSLFLEAVRDGTMELSDLPDEMVEQLTERLRSETSP